MFRYFLIILIKIIYLAVNSEGKYVKFILGSVNNIWMKYEFFGCKFEINL